MAVDDKTTAAKDQPKKKAPKDAPKSTARRIMRWFAFAVVAIILVPVILFGVYYSRIQVPEPKEVATAQISTIFANDGTTELARIVPPEGNRTQVRLADVPKHVQDAVLAAEDREFWTNSGFSFSGFLRAALGVVTGDSSAGGGSTITQQYVKNVLVGNERSVERKLKELAYSIKMTGAWDKETILQSYLNTVYFGRNAYGIQAASQAYFAKDTQDLTVAEGALLASMIQLPSQLDPWTNREGSEQRWNYVLDGMVDMAAITAQERAATAFPETRDPAEYSAYTEATGPNGLIKNQVVAELQRLGFSEEDINTLGLQVTTTIDMQTQEATLAAVEQNLATLQEDAATAVVNVEPATGAVRGYYGGNEANGWDYANAPLQTGSTFKIMGLAAALQQGIPLTAQYSSDPIQVGPSYITNSSGTCGVCSIEKALVNSYNTSFIRLQQDLDNTTQDTADMAHALGVARELPGVGETLRENGEQPYEGIILGQYLVRPLDMATAMATLANRGVWHDTHFIEQIKSYDGRVLYEFDPASGQRRVSAQVADNVIKAMSTIAGYSGGKNLAGGRPSAAKTGTAQLGDTGLNKDAWMVGGTPQLVTAVWVGTQDNTSAIFSPSGGSMYGSGTPATIWKQVLDGALDGKEILSFPQAEPVAYGGFTGRTSYPTYSDVGIGVVNAVPTPEVESAPETSEASAAPTAASEPSAAPEHTAPNAAHGGVNTSAPAPVSPPIINIPIPEPLAPQPVVSEAPPVEVPTGGGGGGDTGGAEGAAG